jgi:hypothetical protein
LGPFDGEVSVMGLVALLFDAECVAACRNSLLPKGSLAHPLVVDKNGGLFWSRLNLNAAY